MPETKTMIRFFKLSNAYISECNLQMPFLMLL